MLRQRSVASGRSVGELIREAIDRMLADESESERAATGAREKALASFLAAKPMPVADWPSVELEIEQEYEREPSPD